MKLFSDIYEKIPQFSGVLDALDRGRTPCMTLGLSAVHKAGMIYALSAETGRQAIVLTADEAQAKLMCDDINTMCGSEIAVLFPVRDYVFRPDETASGDYEQMRLGALSKIASGEARILLASAGAAMQYTLPKQELIKRTRTLAPGDIVTVEDLSKALMRAGYTKRPQVDGIAQFSVRGGIVDFFPPDRQRPVRIEFWGDEIDSIADFELDTQRRTTVLETIAITPSAEVLFDSPGDLAEKIGAVIKKLGKAKSAEKARDMLNGYLHRIESGLDLGALDKFMALAYDRPALVTEYFENPLVFISERADISQSIQGILKQFGEDIKILLEDGEICRELTGYMWQQKDIELLFTGAEILYLDTFARNYHDLRLKELFTINAMQTSSWSGEAKFLTEELKALLEQGYACVVMAGTEKSADTLLFDLERDGINAKPYMETTRVEPGNVYIIPGFLSAGFEFPEAKTALITHSSVTRIKRGRRGKRRGEEIKSLSDLTPGDYVVHVSHGIGQFEGIQKLVTQGITKDYIKIRYAGKDTLYVPVTQLDMVSKYIGPKEGTDVRLNKLNSGEWKKTRSRVKHAVKEMADELIKLYAERAQTKGYAFSKDNEWQREFEERFSYDETDDQLNCAIEIKEDMERPVPMDRLLCGDVGFGKTEVALRAAFKCIMDGKQCAMLCPTTILAWQHYQTIVSRLGNFPVSVELLSRFRTAKEQKEIVKKLKTGEVDFVVGTHRLVQKDIEFRDLGLAIIDEEQRFGVADKERFKEMFRGIDMLTLSATPIPRTLNIAMSGIRDMSVIEQAPQDRQPIQTYVIEHDNDILTEAMRREIRRGGQVYYLHNRVESIEACAARISQRLPEARIGIAHGQMSESELSDVWKQLMENEIDVLVCTTIIETGVDVSNCNTLIIEDADRMGLSQLYQIRGRVGRSSRRAFAYFTFRQGKALSEIATKRLEAIREFTKFGSGLRIAMRDLEIRGAGNILGAKQHGHMEAVGYDMYLRLLSDAISEKRGEKPKEPDVECMVDLQLDAHIPEEYIENLSIRLDIYRKIAAVKTERDKEDVLDELIDRFGEPPKAAYGLLQVALLRNMAASLGFYEIIERGNTVLFYSNKLNGDIIAGLVAALKNRVMVNAGNKPYISVKAAKGETSIDVIGQTLKLCGELADREQNTG